MQKKLYFFISYILAAGILSAQKPFSQQTLKSFEQTTTDSLFITANSDIPYGITTVDFIFLADSSGQALNQNILSAEKATVLGPYHTDSSVYYIKIVNIDSAYKVRVGNIWIDINKGRDVAFQQATRILQDIRNGGNYNLNCSLYSDDGNKSTDCDLGWIYNTSMVAPFAEAIAKHQKDEVYLVETEYGFHIVKSLANPYKVRKAVQYVSLVHKKN